MKKKKERNRKRSGWIDIAKGIGICIIVLGHCCIQDNQIPFRDYLFSFNTVLFFTLSGMTFCRRRNTAGENGAGGEAAGGESARCESTGCRSAVWDFDDRKASVFFRKLLQTIVVPYLCWALISIAIFLLMGRIGLVPNEGDSLGLWTNLKGMLYANSEWGQMMWNRPLWFLPCLAILEILGFMLLKGCTKLAERRGEKAGEVCWLLAGCLGGVWILAEGFGSLDVQLPWEAETAAGMLFFFCLGRVWMRVSDRLENADSPIGIERDEPGVPAAAESSVDTERTEPGVPAAAEKKKAAARKNTNTVRIRMFAGAGGVILLILNILQVRINGTTDTRADLFRNPLLYMLGALLGTLGILLLAYAWKQSVWMEKIGRSSLAILVMHKFPLQAADVLASRLQLPKGYPFSIVTCVCSILLCLAVEPLVLRILPEMLGKGRRR
ncbi:MAG: acyltransferase [Eubacteriales bacterium]|nr:acyltransferase [Eubacteriales bacterium]